MIEPEPQVVLGVPNTPHTMAPRSQAAWRHVD